MNPDKSATRSGLVGRYVTVLDLKASHSGALSPSVRWTKTIWLGSPARTSTNEELSRETGEQGPFSNVAEIDSAPSLNTVSRDKKTRLVCGKLPPREKALGRRLGKLMSQ